MMVDACRPRFATKRDKRRRSFGDEVAAVAEMLGTPLMPWQRQVADTALEFRADGRPWRPTSVVTVCRQSGKTVLVGAVAAWWAMKWPDQHILFMAQTRTKASERLADVALRLTRAGVADVKVYRGIGNEHVAFGNGSTISIESPSLHAAHGDSIDLVVLDEVWTLGEHVLEGVVPAQSARKNSMLWAISTMGTEDSETLNRMVERGREATLDRKASMTLHEWSADLDAGDDIFNPQHWPRWMPALGYTTTVDKIMPDLETLSPSGFRRAYGNVVTAAETELFGDGWWADTFDPYQKPGTDVVYAFDVNSSPAGASIAAAFPTEKGWHVDLVAYEGGESVLWIARELKALIAKRRPMAVATAGGGPARSIMPELEQYCDARVIPFRSMSVQDLGAAAGLLYEGLRTRSLSHGQSESLDMAAERAKAKQTGDLWRFDRKDTRVDVSPLVAASVALFAGQEYAAKAPRPAFYFGG